jgi:hypothetical protein
MNGLLYIILVLSMSSLLTQNHSIIASLENALVNRRFEHYNPEALKKKSAMDPEAERCRVIAGS